MNLQEWASDALKNGIIGKGDKSYLELFSRLENPSEKQIAAASNLKKKYDSEPRQEVKSVSQSGFPSMQVGIKQNIRKGRIVLAESGRAVKIYFGSGGFDFAAEKDKVSSISGRRYDSISKFWEVPMSSFLRCGKDWSSYDVSSDVTAAMSDYAEKISAPVEKLPDNIARSISDDGDNIIVRFTPNRKDNRIIDSIPIKRVAVQSDELYEMNVIEIPRSIFIDHVKKFSDFNVPDDILDEAKKLEASMAEISMHGISKSGVIGSEIAERLKLELMPYQQAGVNYITKYKKVLLCDDMGLGKTAQAIASIIATNSFPAVIVAKAKLRPNWKEEFKKFAKDDLDVFTVTGNKIKKGADVYIVSYEGLSARVDLLISQCPRAIVFDESAKIKDRTAKMSVAARELSSGMRYGKSSRKGEVINKDYKGADMRIAISGTPFINKPQDLINQIAVIGRLDAFGGRDGFAKMYCAPATKIIAGRKIYTEDGSENLDDLRRKLYGTCMVRRLKPDVLPQLPEKRRDIVYVELSNADEYRRAEEDLIKYLKDSGDLKLQKIREAMSGMSANDYLAAKAEIERKISAAIRAEAIVKLGKLRYLCGVGKIDAVMDYRDENEKTVIFGWHVDVTRGLANAYNCPTIIGGDSDKAVQAGKKMFQEDENCKTIVCNILSGGEGHTLTASCELIFAELGWTPASMKQAEDRIHRIGQTRGVVITYIVAKDTIDEHVMNIINNKSRDGNIVMDGTNNMMIQSGVDVSARNIEDELMTLYAIK